MSDEKESYEANRWRGTRGQLSLFGGDHDVVPNAVASKRARPPSAYGRPRSHRSQRQQHPLIHVVTPRSHSQPQYSPAHSYSPPPRRTFLSANDDRIAPTQKTLQLGQSESALIAVLFDMRTALSSEVESRKHLEREMSELRQSMSHTQTDLRSTVNALSEDASRAERRMMSVLGRVKECEVGLRMEMSERERATNGERSGGIINDIRARLDADERRCERLETAMANNDTAVRQSVEERVRLHFDQLNEKTTRLSGEVDDVRKSYERVAASEAAQRSIASELHFIKEESVSRHASQQRDVELMRSTLMDHIDLHNGHHTTRIDDADRRISELEGQLDRERELRQAAERRTNKLIKTATEALAAELKSAFASADAKHRESAAEYNNALSNLHRALHDIEARVDTTAQSTSQSSSQSSSLSARLDVIDKTLRAETQTRSSALSKVVDENEKVSLRLAETVAQMNALRGAMSADEVPKSVSDLAERLRRFERAFDDERVLVGERLLKENAQLSATVEQLVGNVRAVQAQAAPMSELAAIHSAIQTLRDEMSRAPHQPQPHHRNADDNTSTSAASVAASASASAMAAAAESKLRQLISASEERSRGRIEEVKSAVTAAFAQLNAADKSIRDDDESAAVMLHIAMETRTVVDDMVSQVVEYHADEERQSDRREQRLAWTELIQHMSNEFNAVVDALNATDAKATHADHRTEELQAWLDVHSSDIRSINAYINGVSAADGRKDDERRVIVKQMNAIIDKCNALSVAVKSLKQSASASSPSPSPSSSAADVSALSTALTDVSAATAEHSSLLNELRHALDGLSERIDGVANDLLTSRTESERIRQSDAADMDVIVGRITTIYHKFADENTAVNERLTAIQAAVDEISQRTIRGGEAQTTSAAATAAPAAVAPADGVDDTAALRREVDAVSDHFSMEIESVRADIRAIDNALQRAFNGVRRGAPPSPSPSPPPPPSQPGTIPETAEEEDATASDAAVIADQSSPRKAVARSKGAATTSTPRSKR